tara:strand:+ start:37910 stop:38617 length:708 start_codon:yes stop_codon:yes gene_type:complete
MLTAAIQELFTSYFDYHMQDMMTAIPAVVVSTREISQGVVAVKPSINELLKDSRTTEWPEIVDVPILFPSSSSSALTFPIQVGDSVLVVFSMRGLDEFKNSNGGLSTPVNFRNHNVMDAVAIPCIWPKAQSVNKQSNRNLPHNVNDFVMAHNLGKATEAEIRITQAGHIKITSPTAIYIDAPTTFWTSNSYYEGDFTITGEFYGTGTFTYNDLEYNTHIHTGVQSGSNTSGTPTN